VPQVDPGNGIVQSDEAPRPVVLFVEDEPLILIDVLDSVERAGFQILGTHSADEAIKILEGRNDIRVVVTDIDIPGSMDGLKLAQAVRDRWPPIELIIASGKYNLRDEDLPVRGRFFPKPYDVSRLAQTLHELTSSGGGQRA
jgi:DNA-binding NtrC family response regulator